MSQNQKFDLNENSNENDEKSNGIVSFSDSGGVIEEFTNNKVIKKLNKFNTISEFVDDYNEEFKKTKSHVKSTIITGTRFIVNNAIDPIIMAGSIAVGMEVAGVGAFTHPACVAGVVACTTTFIVGSKISENADEIAKNISSSTFDFAKEMKNKLSPNVKKIIYKCVSKPIEKSLETIYEITNKTSEYIKQVVTNVIYDNWNKIEPSGTIIYCSDLNEKKITIELNSNIASKIYNYCNYYSKNSNNFAWDNFNSNYEPNFGSNPYTPKSNFANTFQQFSRDLGDFETKLSNLPKTFNFDLPKNSTSENLTPYEQIKIIRPDTNLLTRTRIDTNSIPNYIVSCSITESRGGFGSTIGIGICFMIKVAIII